jgi:hypothetical protein
MCLNMTWEKGIIGVYSAHGKHTTRMLLVRSCDYFLLRLLIICAKDNRFEELAPSFTCMASAYLTYTGKSTFKIVNLLLTVTCTEQVPPPSPRFSNVA